MDISYKTYKKVPILTFFSVETPDEKFVLYLLINLLKPLKILKLTHQYIP